jgi:hypothetical protein
MFLERLISRYDDVVADQMDNLHPYSIKWYLTHLDVFG